MSSDERPKQLALNGTFDLPLDVHLHTLLVARFVSSG